MIIGRAFGFWSRLTLITSLLASGANALGGQGLADEGLNFSSSGHQAQSRYEQRKLYKSLIFYIKSNQKTKYLRAAPGLKDYPLYPYLEYTDKIQHLSRQPEASIRGFIEKYESSPLANRLRQNYLYTLNKKKAWKTFTRNYQADGATEDNACVYPYALYKTGRKQEAFKLITDLWMVGKSKSKSCDPAFKLWKDAGHLTQARAWQRFSLAMLKGETKLATYLVRFLDRADQALAKEYQAAYKRPTRLTQPRRFKRADAKSRPVIIHLIKRLARKEPSQALSLLKTYDKSQHFDSEMLDEVYTYIAIRLARSPDTVKDLTKIPQPLKNPLILKETLIQTALKSLDYSEALVQIHTLDDEAQNTSRWLYWRARILLGSDSAGDLKAANKLLRKLAGERSYYGFMAADLIDSDYAFEDQPLQISASEILNLESNTGIQRALELFALGYNLHARREWRFTTRDFNRIELQIAAKVAQKWGWHAMSIQAMIQAKSWNDLSVRFPPAYLERFTSSSRAADIPLAWSLAIARQESAFRADARSGSGAMGLMQLLYPTAKSVANKEGLDLSGKQQLIDPGTNIQLGTAYLGEMLRRFNYNRIIASAAYNAGPTRVSRWINSDLPLDVWIEVIPYNETRAYVKNILMFAAIYNRKYDAQAPLIFAHERTSFAPLGVKPRISGSALNALNAPQ